MKLFNSLLKYTTASLFLWIGSGVVAPNANAAGVTGCTVLFYYSPGDTNGASLSKLVTLLQGPSVGANVVTKSVPVGTAGASYDPTGDAWVVGGVPQYTQIWDCRFTTNAQNCGGYTPYGDYFNANWVSNAEAYLTAGGNFFIQGENAGYPSRYMGNDVFLRAIGVSASFTDCPWGATSNDDDATFALQTLASTLPGSTFFQCFQFGGIPMAYTNGTNFVTFSGPWNNSSGTTRAVATGWTAAQMTLGGTAGNLATDWDTTMWNGSYYPSATTDSFYEALYTWLNGLSCSTTPTNTPTPTYTYTPINTPTNTFTFTNTATSTATNTATITATNTATMTATFTAVNTATDTATQTPTNTSTNTPLYTPTNTYTATYTPTFTPTVTPTPPLYAWPNPFNPGTAVSGVFNMGYVPASSKVNIFTVSGETVISSDNGGRNLQYGSPISQPQWEWDGRNTQNLYVSTGVYYYVVQNSGGSTLLAGKLLVITGK